MATYVLISPNGWVGDTIEADSDADAVAIAAAPPYYEHVLDLVTGVELDGYALGEVVGLVVKDEGLCI